MANVVQFVFLGILTIIHVVNCAGCVEKHLEPYAKACHDEGEKEALKIVICAFKKAGLLTGTGHISVDGMKKLFEPHVIPDRKKKADDFFEAVQKCVENGHDTIATLPTCEMMDPVQNLLNQVLCEADEK